MILKEGQVCHIRLINGDELFGKYITSTDSSHIVNLPMVVMEGEVHITLSRYIPYNEDDNVEISMMHIITITPVNPQFERYYYASIKYNKKYIEDRVLEAVGMVSRAMENKMKLDLTNFGMTEEKASQISIESIGLSTDSIH